MGTKSADELPFEVFDTRSNQFVDIEALAEEKWCCDLSGALFFALREDGSLIVCDEDGRFAECPRNRFEVRFCEVD